MFRPGPRRLAAAALFFALCAVATLSRASADFADAVASEDARYAADWVVDAADHAGKPFAIVDKHAARVYVFDGTGHLAGASSALLGSMPGDDASAREVARSAPHRLAPADRTTPAGRFETMPGHNDKGEAIVWVDYDASIAIHRLRPAPAIERRPERLASASTDDKRISFGCIIVPVAFYDDVVDPTLGHGRGVVYVLPEARPVRSMFGAIEVGSAR